MTEEKHYYQRSIAETIEQLDSHAQNGISSEEAQRRLEEIGPNRLKVGKKRSLFLKLLDQFRELLIIVLIVAALLAYYLGDFRGGTILLVIVMVNALIGFYQEFKAEKILDALKQIIRDKATVIREGKRIEIEQADLVPGDLIYMEEGSAIPADVRLISTTGFSTNDFILTGESVPQKKDANLIFDQTTPLNDQDNVVFMGTTVAKGNAYGIVFGTGMSTAIGRIAEVSESIEHDLSPLQREMNILAKSLTKIAGVIALSLFVVNMILTWGTGESLGTTVQLSILFSISVAAACVPQGMPAQISVALSLGVGRLAKKKAIVKKLSAVETLGSTTIICSDKTGTITQNEMTITHGYMQGRIFEIDGTGYSPSGYVLENGKKMSPEQVHDIKQFFQHGFLASNGRAEPPDDDHPDWYAIGDPTECAFTPLAMKAGLDPNDLEERFPVVHELPFDSNRKRMTIIREHNGKTIGYMKGGIDSVLAACDQIHIDGAPIPLTDQLREETLTAAKEFAGEALRVIALAYRDYPAELTEQDKSIETGEQRYVFAGFVAMIDPPRQGVKDAISHGYQAGIRIVMITGDDPVTAKAIAQRIHMKDPEGDLLTYTGVEIEELSDEDLRSILARRSVIFSRVSPEDKYRLVSILKESGDVVAVTGDGVNDTLSLKKSDIGVSMGKAGAEVAKEASEIVLLNDDFSTLVVAIREGRTIFHNLKKTIMSSITSNNGELSCVLLGFAGVAYGMEMPITAVQILAIDLVGEMLPLTAITFDPPEEHTMKRAPRDLNEHIINKKSLINLIFYGFWMGAAGFFSFFMVSKFGSGTVESGRAAAYCAIILCQFANIMSRRTERSVFTRYFFTNRQLLGSFAISAIAISILIYIPAVALWFGFESLSLYDWLFPIIGMLVFLGFHEGHKQFFRKSVII